MPLDVEDIALGHENRHRWNAPDAWVWSKVEAHTPLVAVDLYERAQATIRQRGAHGDAGKAPRRSGHPYLSAGYCGAASAAG